MGNKSQACCPHAIERDGAHERTCEVYRPVPEKEEPLGALCEHSGLSRKTARVLIVKLTPHGRRNCIPATIFVGTARPSMIVGVKRHCRAAFTAAASSIGIDLSTTTLVTRPRSSILTSSMTALSMPVFIASIGYSAETYASCSGGVTNSPTRQDPTASG